MIKNVTYALRINLVIFHMYTISPSPTHSPYPASWVSPTWSLTIGPWRVENYSQKQQENAMKLARFIVERARASAFKQGYKNRATGGRKAIRPRAVKGENPQEPRLKVWKDLEPSEKDQWKQVIMPGLAYGTIWRVLLVIPIQSYIEFGVRMTRNG